MTNYYVLNVDDAFAGEAPKDYDWDSKLSSRSLREYIKNKREFPSFTPNLEIKIYRDREFSQVRDFLHCMLDGLCFSEKVKNIFSEFNLPKHKFYPIKVVLPKKRLKLLKSSPTDTLTYYNLWYSFYDLTNQYKLIDFSKTKIIAETPAMTREVVKVTSSEEWEQLPEKNKMLREELKKYTNEFDMPLKDCFEKVDSLRRQIVGMTSTDEIVFSKDFDHSIDLFEIPAFSSRTYISDRLGERLKKENVTGIDIYRPQSIGGPKLTWQ
ncbi:MAG: hypothetical protein JNK50_13650 [Bacteroidia bacterium]|nr:hypothetical protein [Bacteroidia bacterium]